MRYHQKTIRITPPYPFKASKPQKNHPKFVQFIYKYLYHILNGLSSIYCLLPEQKMFTAGIENPPVWLPDPILISIILYMRDRLFSVTKLPEMEQSQIGIDVLNWDRFILFSIQSAPIMKRIYWATNPGSPHSRSFLSLLAVSHAPPRSFRPLGTLGSGAKPARGISSLGRLLRFAHIEQVYLRNVLIRDSNQFFKASKEQGIPAQRSMLLLYAAAL